MKEVSFIWGKCCQNKSSIMENPSLTEKFNLFLCTKVKVLTNNSSHQKTFSVSNKPVCRHVFMYITEHFLEVITFTVCGKKSLE